MKIKTELCKNWETLGWCKFGDKVKQYFIMRDVNNKKFNLNSAPLRMERPSYKRKHT